MRIPLDRQSDIPLYQQIEEHIRQGILSGSLEEGSRLPASRQLAQDLGVNRITVDTAYAELEADGLIYSQVGSGTFVSPLHLLPDVLSRMPEADWPAWQKSLDGVTGNAFKQVLDQMRTSATKPIIDFSTGIGDARLFPGEDFRKIIQSVMRRDGAEALTYGEIRGYAPLRQTIAHIMASQGLQSSPEQILVTSGSQQAMALVCQLLLSPGDTVFVEAPTYGGAIDLFRSHRVQIMGIPTDDLGMQVQSLETMLQKVKPKLIYTIPNFNNPTGTCLNSQRRRQLIALADHYDVPILEDDFVGDLRYDGRAQPALKSLDPGGRVIYVSTFSKMLMPGLRVGFLAAEGPVYEQLVECKRVHDLATSNLFQRALEAYVSVGRYQAHLRTSCQVYKKRRDAMIHAIQRFLPAEVYLSPPAGGIFIWLRLPAGWSAGQLLPAAARQGLLFAPGNEFFPDHQQGDPYMRLNFASQTPAEIEDGILRLGKACKQYAASVKS